MATETINLKALVDKEKNRVVFVEAEADFLDVLFSFLTMPMGTIIKLIDEHSPTSVGCMNNLYASVKKMDSKYFRTELCRTILLHPQNAARDHNKNLKLKIENDPLRYFLCQYRDCTASSYRLVSSHGNSHCGCGGIMSREISSSADVKRNDFSSEQRVFVKWLTQLLVTDDLQVLLASLTSSIGIFSGLGVTNYDDLEERTFDIGENEVLDLLKCLFISKTPLTNVLLKTEALPFVPDPRKDDNIKSKHPGYQIKEERVSTECKNISIKLVISKSDRKVCYAEAGEDFVDLLFSFLTIPLGYILKEMSNESSKGCMNRLYESVRDIDADKHMNSVDIKNFLLSPKIAPYHGYLNHPLGLEEAKPRFYYSRWPDGFVWHEKLTADAGIVPPSCTSEEGVALSLKDPKSPHGKDTSTGGGYVGGPAMFIVSDDLDILPMSFFSALSILKGMKVPFHDTEEQVVSVGKEEALRLLLAAFSSDSALTHAFLLRQTN